MLDAEISPGRIVVGFAGGGGSSVGVKLALGVDPDVAMNHWLTAVFAHQRHFPETEHRCADVFDVDPRTVRPGERIAFGWFSPDCTDFSKAKGGAPRSARIRGLAWSIIPWALTRRIEVIMLENVEEFLDWGPVHRTGARAGEPIAERRGETFARWKSRLERLGYVVEHRILNAADYGAPTTRKRLFIVARCDGRPIVWPARTHAPRARAAELGLKPWRGACEVIDWSRPCPSLFLTPEEAKAEGVRRPLVKATLGRVARGIERYVVGAAEPFIVPITQRTWAEGRAHGVRDPLKTVTAAKGGEFAVVDPVLGNVVKFQENSSFTDPRDPLHTVMAGATRHGVVETALSGFVSRSGFQSAAARNGIRDPREPMATATSDGGFAAVSAFLGSYYATGIGSACGEPMRAATAQARHALTAAFLEQANTDVSPHDARDPASTIVGKGCTQRLVEARLEAEGGPVGRRGQVLEFLWEHFGEPTAEEWADPLATLRGRLRLGLVVLQGAVFCIVDIGLRMLTPAELAAAMGFPADYHLEEDAFGRPISKTAQTQMIGNAVSPPVAAALIAANCPHLRAPEMEKAA